MPGFIDAARRYVAHTLAITFARVPKRQAGEALRLEGRELDAYLAERVRSDAAACCNAAAAGCRVLLAHAGSRRLCVHVKNARSFPAAGRKLALHRSPISCLQVQRDGWSLDGDIVVLPRNAHNTPSQRQAAEMVPFDFVAPALAGAA